MSHQPLTHPLAPRSHSLSGNNLTNDGEDMSGILKLAEALPYSHLTSLRSAKTAFELYCVPSAATVTRCAC